MGKLTHEILDNSDIYECNFGHSLVDRRNRLETTIRGEIYLRCRACKRKSDRANVIRLDARYSLKLSGCRVISEAELDRIVRYITLYAEYSASVRAGFITLQPR